MLFSCKEGDDLLDNNMSKVPISFSVHKNDSLTRLTRATKLTSMPDFTVYAYDSNGKAVINAGKFNADGTSKDGSIYYWPISGNVTFYAYAPDNSSYVTWNETNKTLTYIADADVNNQQDVIYANTSLSRTADGKVPLNFKHANAGLAVKWSTASDLPSNINVSVNEIQICNLLQTGTLTFNKNISASGNKAVYDLGLNGLMMVSPQSITTWNSDPNHPEKIENTDKAYMTIKCKVKVDSKYLVGSDSEDGTLYYPVSATNIGANTVTTLNLSLGTKRFDATRIFGYDTNGKAVRYVPPYEDLGLSVKWATCNLDANYPEESGKYYAWASTVGYDAGSHTWSLDDAPYHKQGGGVTSYTKYKMYDTLESKDDAASVRLGLSYHIPTAKELLELRNKCTFSTIYNYGILGVLIKGPNGNSIFYPDIKLQNDLESEKFDVSTKTFISGGTLNDEFENHVLGIPVNQIGHISEVNVGYIFRYCGNAIRPVYKEVPSINIGTGTTTPEESQAKPNKFK